MKAKINKKGILVIEIETKSEKHIFGEWLINNVIEAYSVNGGTWNINGDNVLFKWDKRRLLAGRFWKHKIDNYLLSLNCKLIK